MVNFGDGRRQISSTHLEFDGQFLRWLDHDGTLLGTLETNRRIGGQTCWDAGESGWYAQAMQGDEVIVFTHRTQDARHVLMDIIRFSDPDVGV